MIHILRFSITLIILQWVFVGGFPIARPIKNWRRPANTVNKLVAFASSAATTSTSGECQQTTTTPISSSSSSITELTTPPMQVYIEDTDAYGVIYNANYLRAYDRALHMTSFFGSSSSDRQQEHHSSPVLQHNGWSIAAVEKMRYKQSPPLGGSFVIRGKLRCCRRRFEDDASDDEDDTSPSVTSEIWDLEMTSPDGTTVYHTAEGVQIALPKDVGEHWLPQPEPFDVVQPPTAYSKKDTFQTFRDEFDPHLTTHLSLSNLLKLFERSRSNLLGGPDALHRLQVEDGILFVVVSNSHCALTDYSAPPILPGMNIAVETGSVLKRRRIIDCYQTAYHNDEIMGQCVTTIMAINAETKRPVSKLPDWVLKNLGVS